ncbi:MAG: chloride channel protein [Bacteroidota bacterium]
MSVKQDVAAFIQILLRWTLLVLLTSFFAGTLSAIFLIALNSATVFRDLHPWLLYFLPLAGLAVGLLYHYLGNGAERGNNLIFDTIHNPGDVIPFKMAPLVLVGTVVTHLFGGSAGREGTALQMSAAAADQLHEPFRLTAEERVILLISALSAGFASVFGTPLAGAIFGIEVLLIRKFPPKAIVPAFAAAFLGAWITELWGVTHTHYHINLVPALSLKGLVYCILAGMAFAIAAVGFVRITHLFSNTFKRIAFAPLRPFTGGIMVIFFVLTLDAYRYVGLGIPLITGAFESASAPQDFAWKILLTAITLGSGFKGGEVTPLFFIGATLGSALSLILPLPVGLLAGMGFVAVFAGAAKTPLACMVMAMELFGLPSAIFVMVSCMVAYFISGKHSIYNVPENKSPKHFLFG